MMQVRRYLDSLLFLDRAGPFLMRNEAEHGIMLGLRGRPGSRPPVFGPDCYLGVVEDDGDVVACALRTPPFGAIVSSAGRAAIERLVDDLASMYESLPAVLGPEPAVSVFAQVWSARRGTSVSVRMRQRLFEIRRVEPLALRPEGMLRMAASADLPTLTEWAAAFHADSGLLKPIDPRRDMEYHVSRETVFVWDADGPVSMAGYGGRTARGVRISFVYTPPEHRRKGYASACVADLTERLLREGQAFCTINTDLANPTSNKIYQAIGYRPVCDMTDFDLSPPPNR